MSGYGTPPAVPTQFQIVNTGKIDQDWQRKFTIIWTSGLAFFIVISLPLLVRALRSGTALKGLLGISELWYPQYRAIEPSISVKRGQSQGPRKIEAALNRVVSPLWWCIPGLSLNIGQVLLIVSYLVVVLVCITVDASLMKNANRAAVAQLPIVFLFAAKNSVLSLLLGPGNGYEKLNFIHKWSGRSIFIAALLHGALWIRDHLELREPILGEIKETSGIAAFALLCILVLTSILPVRRYFYQVFYIIHFLTYVSFFITLCYHTPYATPWIFPPLAFYGLDILLRMVRLRIKDAVLVPVDSQMTLIHIPDCTDGWTAGQYIRLRVFLSGRLFESHPLSIFTAPPDISCVKSLPQGVNLGARVMGDWTKAINDYAAQTVEALKKIDEGEACAEDEKEKGPQTFTIEASAPKQTAPLPEVPVQVMLDGPYGGCGVDLGRYETVLLFAGGSGATFTLGLLDDIVGRCVKRGREGGEITKRIEFAWCVRSFGAIDWFGPALMDIATLAASSDLSLHISVYVTCLCNPEAIPPIPNCDVTIVRPSIYKVLLDIVTPPETSGSESTASSSDANAIQVIARTPAKHDAEHKRPGTATTHQSSSVATVDSEAFEPSVRNRLPWVGTGGGLAVCASGPENLTREAANALARLQLSKAGGDVGIVGLHTEVFAL
ncbi:hypothetical protein EST38_g11309 [Candolleomyces aberdarensis]|uniref:FAD-binding FR-type domain-containing protein n=1 Tax=Candolleomyces aberdarensis TaxID=2316362 RepID=A0A4Q2D7I5_9AGAR|nr:hypothetical protein EST38_g11309 [Candolleomyces aberdarensis]